MLRAADVGGSLNSQVVEMLQNFHPWHFRKCAMFLDLWHTWPVFGSGGLRHWGREGHAALPLQRRGEVLVVRWRRLAGPFAAH